MNPTEIIATKLLGWRHDGYWPSGGKRYKHPNHPDCRVYEDGEGVGSDAWPDLSDWNDIRRMEDTLAEKGIEVWCKYLNFLMSDFDPTAMSKHLKPLRDCGQVSPDAALLLVGAASALSPTTEQRVAAALKVIEEAGL
jgi:hypothetical protein